MHAFFALVEAGHAVVPAANLAASLAPEELAALREARIVQPLASSAARAKVEEISVADLVRVLRALYDVDARGLSTPASVGDSPVTIGWCGEGANEREVAFVGRPRAGLFSALARTRRTLALLPTGQYLTDAQRARHGKADAFVAVEVLAEALTVRGGRLVRASTPTSTPTPTPTSTPTPTLTPTSTSTSTPTLTPTSVPGVSRWNEVTIALVDERTVRIDVAGGRSYRRTHIDLGMAHAQSREPTRVWQLLVALCEGNGYLQTSRFGGVQATKKLVSRLRSDLKAAFGLDGDPLHPWSRNAGWRTRFVAKPDAPRG